MLKSNAATGAVGVVFALMAIIQAIGFFFGQVGSDIKESGKYFSYWPVQDARSWLHFLGRVNKIEELTQRLKNVESVLAETNKNKE
mgnify:CR=1 FL=1